MTPGAIVDLSRAPRPALNRWLAACEDDWLRRLWWQRRLVPADDDPSPAGRCVLEGGEVIGGYLLSGAPRAPILEGPYVAPPWRGRGWVGRLAEDAARFASDPAPEVMTIAFDGEDAGPAFVAAGFGWLQREFRARTPSAAAGERRPSGDAAGVRLIPWPGGGTDLGGLLFAAFRDTVDGQASRLYQSPTRCALYLDRFARGGDGATFAVDVARLAVGERGRPVGLLAACRTAPRTVHIAQVAVHPEARGLGVGRLLMQHAITAATGGGVRRLTLFNTAGHGPAAAWYERLGFRVVLRAGWGWRGRESGDGRGERI